MKLGHSSNYFVRIERALLVGQRQYIIGFAEKATGYEVKMCGRYGKPRDSSTLLQPTQKSGSGKDGARMCKAFDIACRQYYNLGAQE